jgi:hypothetical protein
MNNSKNPDLSRDCLPFFAAMLICLVLAGNLQAAEAVPEIRDVEIKMVLLDVDEIDNVKQSFSANLATAMRWRDQSLAHAGPDSISKPLTEIWYPSIQILNQQRIVATFPQTAEIYPDGTVMYRQRYWGSFSQPLELRTFPFDAQKLTLTLANVGFGMRSVRLLPSPESGISEQFSMPDWKVTGWDFVALELPIEEETTPVRGMVFSLDVTRDTSYFKYKVILPLVLIVMMSWMVFWIDPSLVATQISVSVTAMLTMIAYRFALAGLIPRLAFLTSLDFFVLVSTLAVFISMIEVLYTAHLATHDQIEKARLVDRHARWVVPLIYLGLAAETLYFRIVF